MNSARLTLCHPAYLWCDIRRGTVFIKPIMQKRTTFHKKYLFDALNIALRKMKKSEKIFAF